MENERSSDYRDDTRRAGWSRGRGKGGVPQEALAGWRLSARAGRIATRFAEVVCPPEVRAEGRTDRVLGDQLHCAGTNNCTNGCPTGAKRLRVGRTLTDSSGTFPQRPELNTPNTSRRSARTSTCRTGTAPIREK